MTFKDVIIRNFTRGTKKYISFFFSGVFCVAMFFIYSTLLLMDDVINSNNEYPMQLLFIVVCLIIALFSIFFISYAMGNFIRSRKKELGTYMVLGLNEQRAIYMLGIETVLISAAALFVGIVTGTLFSRLFQLIVLNMLKIDNMEYSIRFLNFVLTVLVFIVIDGISFMAAVKSFKKEELAAVVKSGQKRVGRTYRKYDSILAIIGVVLMIFSAVFILNVAGDNHINSKPWVIAAFLGSGYVGLYLIITSGGRALINQMKHRKKYYRNMLSVRGIEYKYSQNSGIILVLAFLASMIILLSGSPIALLSVSGEIAEDGNSDIEFAAFSDYDEAEVTEIITRKKTAEWNKNQLKYFTKNGLSFPVMSVSEYNETYNSDIILKQGEIYNLITTWVPGDNGVVKGGNYYINDNVYTVSDSVKNEWDYPGLFNGNSVILVSDADYEELRDELADVEVNIIMYEGGWKDTEKIVNDLKNSLGENCFVNSRIEKYKNLYNGYSVFMFVCCSMCMMFFISSGFVLFFKQYNDVDEERQQYRQLWSIGISDREIKKSINIKMAVVYFTPIIGAVPGILIMFYMSSLFGGQSIVQAFMKKSPIGLLGYVVLQTIFYIILKFRYEKDVVKI